MGGGAPSGAGSGIRGAPIAGEGSAGQRDSQRWRGSKLGPTGGSKPRSLPPIITPTLCCHCSGGSSTPPPPGSCSPLLPAAHSGLAWLCPLQPPPLYRDTRTPSLPFPLPFSPAFRGGFGGRFCLGQQPEALLAASAPAPHTRVHAPGVQHCTCVCPCPLCCSEGPPGHGSLHTCSSPVARLHFPPTPPPTFTRQPLRAHACPSYVGEHLHTRVRPSLPSLWLFLGGFGAVPWGFGTDFGTSSSCSRWALLLCRGHPQLRSRRRSSVNPQLWECALATP